MNFINRVTLLIVALFQTFVSAQSGQIVNHQLHSKNLENTVTNEIPDRDISIYLPPSYAIETSKKYPVVYLLHGIQDTNETWLRPWNDQNPGFATIKEVLDQGISAGDFGEMIVVMPNQRTHFFGSFYTNSSVTGRWEDFTVKDLVHYVDSNYRTIPSAESRGLAGHSMGGYGALVLGMKYPDIFNVVYGLNPALIDFYADLTIECPSYRTVLEVESAEELFERGKLYDIGVVTVAQAFSPNPDNPPFFVDFPFQMKDDKLSPDPSGYRKWKAHSAIRMVESHRDNLMKLKGYRFDSGNDDEFHFIPVGCREFSRELRNNGVPHIFEEYGGDHRNKLWGKNGRLYREVFPYFWKLLESK